MSVTIAERPGRRRESGRSVFREYVITNAPTEADATTALLAGVPSTVNSLPLLNSACDVDEVDDTEGLYYGTAVWGTEGFEFQPPDSFELSFDVGTETAHITHSLSTVSSHGTSPPDFKQAINVTPEGEVLGADILIPHLGYSFTLTVSDDDMSNAYVLILADVCGTVNNATFHGFAAGELLLVRVSGQRRSDGHWNITFGYLVSRNRVDLDIGGIAVAAKNGWDYLWVYYAPASDPGTGVLMRVPRYAYVERVYYRTDHDSIFPP